MQVDLHIRGQELRNQSRHSAAQVNVHSRLHFLGRPRRNSFPDLLLLALFGVGRNHCVSQIEHQVLYSFLQVGGLYHFVDVDSRKVHVIRIQRSGFNDLLCLADCQFRGPGEIGVEIAGGFVETQIALCIRYLRFNQGHVPIKGLLVNKVPPVDIPPLFFLGVLLHLLCAALVFHWIPSGFNQSSKPGRSVKGRHARTCCSAFLNQCPLSNSFNNNNHNHNNITYGINSLSTSPFKYIRSNLVFHPM